MSLAQQLILHTDKTGCVWFGHYNNYASATNLSVADFLACADYVELLAAAKSIRLLGLRDNAALIVGLQDKRTLSKETVFPDVQLGSPAIVPAAWSEDNPRYVLQYLWQSPPVVRLAGNWHKLLTADYISYAMLLAMDSKRATRDVPAIVKRMVRYHPAWTAFSFINNVSEDAACRLLCDIVDPRWFRHHTHPTRLSKLNSYLGLTPQNIGSCVGASVPGLRFNRAANALHVWYNKAVQRNSSEPGDFLVRMLLKYKGDLAKGLLRTTQKLITFVSAVWLNAVREPHPETGFDPFQFFGDGAEAKAFVRHVTTCKQI